MSLRKTAELETPHATFISGDFEYRVLRVNAPKKTPHADFVTWFVAARSPYTFGSWEYGDTYAKQVMSYVTSRTMTDEFKAYMEGTA